MNKLIINKTLIQLNDKGLYCLNDIHRASGFGDNKSPRRWGDNRETKDLVKELDTCRNFVTLESINGIGTFVCKELVYAYTMWLSPKFHLQVIKVFDDYMMEKKSKPLTEKEMVLGYLKALEDNERLQLENKSKDERIELITDKVNDRASKKKLRLDIVAMCRQYDKKCGYGFGTTIADCYHQLLSNRVIDWYGDYQKATNKLEYFATKDIRWLKELHDIAVSITGGLMKPQRIVDVEQEYIPS